MSTRGRAPDTQNANQKPKTRQRVRQRDDSSTVVPEFIEIPRSGAREPHTILTRSALDLLTRPQQANDFNPPVQSRLFFQTGSKLPRRLVHYPSLLAYLHSLPDGADPSTIARKQNQLPKAKTGNARSREVTK
jgi:hypothetical protein